MMRAEDMMGQKEKKYLSDQVDSTRMREAVAVGEKI